MKKISSEKISDQFHWIILLVFALVIGWERQFDFQTIIILSSAIFFQILITVSPVKYKDWLLVLIQSLLFLVLNYYFANLQSSLLWLALLPVIGIAVNKGIFETIGISIGLFVGLYFVFSRDLSTLDYFRLIWLPFAVILLIGLMLVFLFNKQALNSIQNKEIERNKEAASIRLERLRKTSMLEVSETLSAALDFDHVLELGLDLIDNIINENLSQLNNLHSSILLANQDNFLISAARRYSYADLEIIFNAKEGLLAEVANGGKAQFLLDPKSDSELARISILQTANVALCYPLNSGMDLFGLLLLTHEDPDYFTQDRMSQIEAIALQLSSALRNAHLYESLEFEKERLSHVEEQARRQLARNLHNGLTQSIAAITMRVNLARRMMDKDKDGAIAELFSVEELARRTIKDIRFMLFTLRPEILEKEGFIPAMEDLAKNIADNYDQTVRLDLDKKILKKMDLGRQSVLFSVVVEALSNAIKHAEAENISFGLKQDERDIVRIEIEDDGKGFAGLSEKKRSSHGDQAGIRIMQDRVELLNGLIRIESSPGKGSKIQIWIPMNDKAAIKLRQESIV